MQKWNYGGRIRTVIGSALLLVGMWSGAAAQLPEPPVDSEVAFRVLPMVDTESKVDRRALKSHPLPRMIGAYALRASGIEPFEFIDATFEGTMVGAILAGEDEHSGIIAFLEDSDRRRDWESAVSEIESLASDLEAHYGSSEELYPKDLQPYLDEIRYYEPYLSDGVTYRYEVTDGGKGFRITTNFGESGLAELGKPPIFASGEEPLNRQPTLKAVPLNTALAVKLKSKGQLESLMTKLVGPQEGGFWRFPVPDTRVEMVSTIRGDWFILADDMKNLGRLLRSLDGRSPGWSGNPSFQRVAKNLTPNSPFIFFADTEKLVRSIPFTEELGEQERRLVKLAGPIGYSVVPYGRGQMRIEAFIGVNAPEGSPLEAYMNNVGGPSAANSIDVSNIPWDTSNAFALDYQNCKGLVDAAVALFPEQVEDYEMAQDVMAGMAGIDAEVGFDGLLEGPAIVTFERIDIVLNAMEGYWDTSQALRSKYGGPIDADSDDEAVDAAEAPEEAPLFDGNMFPMTLALKVPSETNRDRLLGVLRSQIEMKDEPVENLFGADIFASVDGKSSYAVDGDWVYLSGGRSERLMKRMLQASHGRKQTLASIDSWSRLTVGTKGRVIGFAHQKVDALYSIAKGLVLLLGADFRPMAEEIGELRDYHSVMTVVPDGILAVGEVVRGDER